MRGFFKDTKIFLITPTPRQTSQVNYNSKWSQCPCCSERNRLWLLAPPGHGRHTFHRVHPRALLQEPPHLRPLLLAIISLGSLAPDYPLGWIADVWEHPWDFRTKGLEVWLYFPNLLLAVWLWLSYCPALGLFLHLSKAGIITLIPGFGAK